MKNAITDFLGEFIGTFILVFFGCGSVAASLFFGTFGLFEVAMIWGLGVMLGIYAAKDISHAHLNPAVTFAMLLVSRVSWRRVPSYFLGQFLGAFMASVILFLLFDTAILNFEMAQGIIRGEAESYRSASMFGEFFPNPGFESFMTVSHGAAIAAETLGTFLLVLMIFFITSGRHNREYLNPLYVGLTVTAIICIIAPFTQAGLNPARDFGPRICAYLLGWGEAAFPRIPHSFLTVYILGPLLGGALASFCYKMSGSKTDLDL